MYILFKLVRGGDMSKKGFSLIETMIGVGIAGILTLALTEIISNQQKQLKRLELKSSLITLQGQIKSALSNVNLCSKILSDQQFGAISSIKSINLTNVNFTTPLTSQDSTIDLIKIPMNDSINSPTIITKNEPFEYMPGTTVDEITISDYIRNNSLDDTELSANLYIKISSKNLGAVKPIKIPIKLNTSNNLLNARTIDSCTTGDELNNNSTTQLVSVAVEQTCASLNGTFDSSTQKCNLATTPAVASTPATVTTPASTKKSTCKTTCKNGQGPNKGQAVIRCSTKCT